MALNDRFLPALIVVLENMAERGLFTHIAAEECPDGHPYFWNPDKMRRQLIAQLGRARWPLDADADADMPDEDIIQYVEALFLMAAMPTKSWNHPFCGNSHPTAFDASAGRYAYTVDVNALFSRFNTGYWMQSGTVRSSGSRVLDAKLLEPLPYGDDAHLRRLVTTAITEFRSPAGDKTASVRNLADAYERIKTTPEGANKAESTRALIAAMTPEEALHEHLDGILRTATIVSNDYTIRHHEQGKTEIADDTALLEFLFYMYFNIVRFALLRLNAIR